jgi:hypothetical protein
MARYVEPRTARHRVEIADQGERLRIPTRRSWPMVVLVCAWLVVWSMVGVVAFIALTQRFELFMLFLAIVWAAMWLGLVAIAGSLLAGSERVRVVGSDLEISAGVGPLRSTRRFRGEAIRNLRRVDSDGWMSWLVRSQQPPIFWRQRCGAVQFDYGADTYDFANGVEGAEGGQIAEWLAKRLPRGAAASASPAEDLQASV